MTRSHADVVPMTVASDVKQHLLQAGDVCDTCTAEEIRWCRIRHELAVAQVKLLMGRSGLPRLLP
jgi:hypothetical protein